MSDGWKDWRAWAQQLVRKHGVYCSCAVLVGQPLLVGPETACAGLLAWRTVHAPVNMYELRAKWVCG